MSDEVHVYHRRVGCVRLYLAVKGEKVWTYNLTDRHWVSVDQEVAKTSLEKVGKDAVKYAEARWLALPSNLNHLPQVPEA